MNKVLITLILFASGLCHAMEPIIRNIGPIDEQFMAKQTALIDDLSKRQLGRSINGNQQNDIEVMQTLLDRRIVTPKQRLELQAMGVILGNIIRKQERLKWVAYIDQYGRSKALMVPEKDDVIFPITMISRRVEAGNTVDIQTIYDKAIAEVESIRKKIIVR